MLFWNQVLSESLNKVPLEMFHFINLILSESTKVIKGDESDSLALLAMEQQQF